MTTRCLQSNQPPSQSDINYEIRPGYSWLYQVRHWKSPRMEMAKLLWATCSNDGQPSWWKSFPYNQSETLLFQFESVSHPLVMQHCEEPVLLDNLLIDIVRLLLGLPEATKERLFFFPPGWTRTVPSVSIYSVNATASSSYWWPAAKLAPIYRCLTFTEDPKLAVVF